MAEETIQIIRIETGEAVKSVNDLRENVKILKDRLGDLEIGTTEYQDTLEELKVNQAAVKDAMYASTASMDDLAKSATGTSNSYNSLWVLNRISNYSLTTYDPVECEFVQVHDKNNYLNGQY